MRIFIVNRTRRPWLEVVGFLACLLIISGWIYQDYTWDVVRVRGGPRDHEIWCKLWKPAQGHIVSYEVASDAYRQRYTGWISYKFIYDGEEFSGSSYTKSFPTQNAAASTVQTYFDQERTQGFITVYHAPRQPMNNSLADRGPKMGLPYGFLAMIIGLLLFCLYKMPEDSESFIPGAYRSLAIGHAIGIPLGFLVGTVLGWGLGGNRAAFWGYAIPVAIFYLWWLITADRSRSGNSNSGGCTSS